MGNTGQIVVDAPDDGWTLESWDGHDVDTEPEPATELFVDLRDLITAPQTAAWHLWEAVLGGDADEISNALDTGAGDVWDAVTQSPDAVVGDLAGAFSP